MIIITNMNHYKICNTNIVKIFNIFSLQKINDEIENLL